MLRLGKRSPKLPKAIPQPNDKIARLASLAVQNEVAEKLKLGYRVSGLVNGKLVVLNETPSKPSRKSKKKR